MTRLNLAVAACVATLSVAVQPCGCQQAGSHASTETVSPADAIIPVLQRRQSPEFTLKDANGEPLTLSSLKGKVVLLDFWATWCGGCKVEIPWYVQFDKEYRDKGLAVVGVAMEEEGMKVVKPFLAQKKIDYAVVIGNDQIAKQYNMTQMPMTLLIDRDGKIAVSHTGIVNRDSFENNIQNLLQSTN